MARYACTHGIRSFNDIERLKGFDCEGYVFNPSQSSESKLVWDRAKPVAIPPKKRDQALAGSSERVTASIASGSTRTSASSAKPPAGRRKRKLATVAG